MELNCDYMCPNCAKYSTLTNLSHNIFDARLRDRPLYQKRMQQGDQDYFTVTNRLLQGGRTSLWENERSKDLVFVPIDDVDLTPPHLQRVDIVTQENFGDVEQEVIRVLTHGVIDESKQDAALIFTDRMGHHKIYYARTSDLMPGEHDSYNGHRHHTLEPLTMLYVHASARGHDLRKAHAYFRGPLDVNCALKTAVAGPQCLNVLGTRDKIAPGALGIFQIAKQPVVFEESGTANPYSGIINNARFG